MRCPENFFGRYSCRLKNQEDEVFGRILLENKVEFKKLDDLEGNVGSQRKFLSRPTDYSISEDPKEEPIEEEHLEEPKEEG
ncbi:hypothetical protein Tco_0064510 [Tanacetum coccineum]